MMSALKAMSPTQPLNILSLLKTAYFIEILRAIRYIKSNDAKRGYGISDCGPGGSTRQLHHFAF